MFPTGPFSTGDSDFIHNIFVFWWILIPLLTNCKQISIYSIKHVVWERTPFRQVGTCWFHIGISPPLNQQV
jgi:hypothetical protein